MKIGIDVSQIVYPGGVSVYTENLVNALLEIDKINDYSLFFSSLRKSLKDSKFKTQNLKKYKIPPTVLDILWNKLHVLPIEHFIGDIDVFHSSDWTQPPAKKAKLVTTIHDLSFLRWPKSTHPKILTVQKRRLKWVKKEVDQIIAVSRATKKEIIELLGIRSEKITVVHEGISQDVKNFQLSLSDFQKLKKRFGIRKRYLFAYGSVAPRKNIEKAIKAFEMIKEKIDCQLIIIGNYEPKFKPPKGVILTGFLSRKEMVTLFSQAAALVYPSLYEGFGLPILEAFALSVPVITSDVSSMPEVAGKAAVLVSPKSEKLIAEGIVKILSDDGLRKEMMKAGKERIKLFGWKKAARETIKVYKKTISGCEK